MMNFAVIRRDDCYYVDKTRFIPMTEEADKFFFFIRPRRFGKSLTVNMLQHYYDILAKDKFEALFGDLAGIPPYHTVGPVGRTGRPVPGGMVW